MSVSLRAILLIACFGCAVSLGQEKSPESGKMMMDAMAAKKKLMAPEVMEKAKKEMTGEKSIVPAMVAKEMMIQGMMKDTEFMGMVKKGAMAPMPQDEMMSVDKMKMAGDKMINEPSQMQLLFQELIARHIAAKKMSMMAKSDDGKKKAAQGKPMMMDEKMMMDAKKDIKGNDANMMMAREVLIHSLMLDKEVMAVVEKEAMMQEDPKMAPMMSDNKMMMAGEEMMKSKEKTKEMMQEAMMRQMTDGKKGMMKDGAKK